jgi:SpoIID/LytB domain protein
MGEVPSSWPQPAIQAQTIAARTYALRAMAVSGELCDSDRCQVYVGASKESAGQSAAVDATTGQVITYGGALATAVYSADAGGFTANTFEGFGTPDGAYPYLTNRQYDTPDPLPWHVDVALADLGRRFGYGGTVTGVRITQQGPSGRAMEVTLDGDAGPLAIGGRQFSSRLGLRSTLFTGTVGSASIAPPPPPAADDAFVEQALPDDSAALTAAVAAPTDLSRDANTVSAAESVHAKALVDTPLDVARDLATSPAAYAGIATLGLATAIAMAWAGGLVPALPFLPTTRPARAALDGWRPRRRRGP